MTTLIPYANGFFTLAENSFNLIGYLPKSQFPRLHAWSTTWRLRYGKAQVIGGLALYTLGLLVHCLNRPSLHSKYLTFPQKMMSLGLLYANHGLFNVIRFFGERQGLSPLTMAYDFYGRKVLPALNPSFDLQSRLFERMRSLLDRMHFATFFPPDISFKLRDAS